MEALTPERCDPQDPRLAGVLMLIRMSFAGMEGRIDPPSSMHWLTAERIAEQARVGEVWVCGSEPVACIFLIPRGRYLHVSKLAVSRAHRGAGLARLLFALAEERAVALGLDGLELQTRVELTENHAIFAKWGFVITDETAHPGFDHPTSLTMRKSLPADRPASDDELV